MRQAPSILSIQEESAAAVRDGLDHRADLCRMSNVGAGGSSPQNCERDFVRMMFKHLSIPAVTIPVPVLRYCKAAGKVRKAYAEVICPHLFFNAISETSIFDDVFGLPEDWEAFWVANKEEVWRSEHPMFESIDE